MGPEIYPNHIHVIGGGRWARVLTSALVKFLPNTTLITIHSRYSIDILKTWLKDNQLTSRINLSEKLPVKEGNSQAAVVVNQASEHFKTSLHLISEGIPHIIEKPVTFSYEETKQLSEEAKKSNCKIASAHIFLFSPSFDLLKKKIEEVGLPIKEIKLCWEDFRGENRHGDLKKYDPSLPNIVDRYPHVLSLIFTLCDTKEYQLENLKFSRGGADILTQFKVGSIDCEAHLIRNGEGRKRSMEIDFGNQKFELDFSKEPWNLNSSLELTSEFSNIFASELMLKKFLQWANGAWNDSKLDFNLALEINKAIDATMIKYYLAFWPWIINNIWDSNDGFSNATKNAANDDLCYGISEILLLREPISNEAAKKFLSNYKNYFTNKGV